MSRSAYQIAATGRDDLYAVQEAFTNLHALFVFLKERVPEEHLAHATAELGIGVIEDWSDKVFQWADCMESELDDLEEGGVQ